MDDQRKDMGSTEAQVMIRTTTGLFVVFGGFFGALFLLWAYLLVVKGLAALLPTALVALVASAFLTVFATTRLLLTSDAIHYRSGLVSRDVALSDVVKAKFVTGFHSTKPFQRLVVTARDADGEREITINLGLFARPDIRRWMEALDERLL